MESKRNAIFLATNQLLNQKISPKDITISEIAEAAGIGKGTVYEYFSSKNEIIESSTAYFCEELLNRFNQLCLEHGELKSRVFAFMEIISFATNEYHAIFQNMLNARLGAKSYNLEDNQKKYATEFYNRLTVVFYEIIKPGQTDGTLRSEILVAELYFSFISIMSFLSSCVFLPKEFSDKDYTMTQQDKYEFCYKQLVKSLS